MNRIVLAILALFAGLAAQVAPAEARLCGEVEIGATLGIRPAARIAAVQAAEPFRAEPQREVRGIVPVLDALPLVSAVAPAVRLGADRARE